MKEDDFADDLRNALALVLPSDYEVLRKVNLLYKIVIDSHGNHFPTDASDPRRGKDFAFQTDLLIKRKADRVPRVVIETKIHNPTTHDILTYSTKAMKHKEVYPYLRYGLVILSNDNRIATKFFVHNTGFDFAAALDSSKTSSYWANELRGMIMDQLEASESLQRSLDGKVSRKFSTKVNIS